jgi:hypothetical protein
MANSDFGTLVFLLFPSCELLHIILTRCYTSLPSSLFALLIFLDISLPALRHNSLWVSGEETAHPDVGQP